MFDEKAATKEVHRLLTHSPHLKTLYFDMLNYRIRSVKGQDGVGWTEDGDMQLDADLTPQEAAQVFVSKAKFKALSHIKDLKDSIDKVKGALELATKRVSWGVGHKFLNDRLDDAHQKMLEARGIDTDAGLLEVAVHAMREKHTNRAHELFKKKHTYRVKTDKGYTTVTAKRMKLIGEWRRELHVDSNMANLIKLHKGLSGRVEELDKLSKSLGILQKVFNLKEAAEDMKSPDKLM